MLSTKFRFIWLSSFREDDQLSKGACHASLAVRFTPSLTVSFLILNKMEQILEGIILCMQISRVKHMKLIANNRSQNFNISSNEENK
jgi:hypothetical protein